MSAPDYRLGIDGGGRNTDAVILDCSDQVRAKVKAPTTADVTSGDLVIIGAGGGTVLGGTDQAVRLGQVSISYRLREEALVFGGSTPTLIDSAVATGRAVLRDPAITAPSRRLLEAAAGAAGSYLADAIDRVKTAKGDMTLIGVGGGSILIPDGLPGVSEVVRPEHLDTANATGAAIAAVSGQVGRIFHFGSGGRKAALAEASDEARDHAFAAGADLGSVQIIELAEIPPAYLASPAVRIRAKAAGTPPRSRRSSDGR